MRSARSSSRPAATTGPAGPGYGSLSAPGGYIRACSASRHPTRAARSPTVHVLLREGLRVLVFGGDGLSAGAGRPRGRLSPLPSWHFQCRQAVCRSQGQRPRPPLRRRRVQPGGGRGGAPAVRADDARGGRRARHRRRARGDRRRADPGRLAGSRRARGRSRSSAWSAAIAAELRRSLAAGIPVELGIGAGGLRRQPRSRRGGAVLEHRGSHSTAARARRLRRPWRRARDLRAGAGRGRERRGTAPSAGRAPRLRSSPVRRRCSPRRGPISTHRASAGRWSRPRAGTTGGDRARRGGTPPPRRRPSSSSPIRRSSRCRPSSATKRGVTAERDTIRNVSRRVLAVRLQPGAAAAGVTVRTRPERVVIRPGKSKRVAVSMKASVRPAAPGALEGASAGRRRAGHAPADPVDGRGARVPPGDPRARLTSATFEASDRTPAVLSLVAGRVDGSAERPQLLPLARLEIELFRGKRRVGTLVRLRDILPGPVRVRGDRTRPPGRAAARRWIPGEGHRRARRRREPDRVVIPFRLR